MVLSLEALAGNLEILRFGKVAATPQKSDWFPGRFGAPGSPHLDGGHPGDHFYLTSTFWDALGAEL